MVATVTLNPCIDKTVSVEQFDIYRMNRVQIVRTDPSGKGINVSKTLKELGVETICTGFDFTDGTPSPLVMDLDVSGIKHSFVPVKGALRVCTKIFDRSRKHTIEVNETGSPVRDLDINSVLERIVEIAKQCDLITLSGSLPIGVDKTFYRDCLMRIKTEAPNCRTIVDADREALLYALEAAPYLIKPNIEELENTFGCKAANVKELDDIAQKILSTYDLSMICISLGAEGAYVADKNQAYICEPVKVEIRSLQGAGDSMVAGICVALEKRLPLSEILKYGIASSGATIMQEGTQVGSCADFDRLLKSNFVLDRLR